ncbi:MAG TPA: S8 family serine peptidase [Pseudonocardiaceae bacterium]|jgi:subtilisin family serine protease|nr:S8 family serine peptidase [Pseudonocardiaceae bacterium]
MRTITAAAVALGTAVAVTNWVPDASAVTAAQPLSPQLIAQLSTGPTQPVIVLLRNQHANLPANRADDLARTQATRSDQAALVSQVKQTGAKKVTQFSVINGFAATMTTAESANLASNPQVAAVVPDLPIREAPQAPAAQAAPAAPAKAPAGACPTDPAKPLLEPEALQATNDAFSDTSAPQAQNLVTGTGVKVAYLADSVDINNPDFIRADGSKVFSDYQDFTGEGTATPNDDREAFGDASSIAAQGRQTYDLSTFVNPANALPKGCDIQIRGMAPGASLVGLKVIASNGFGSTSAVVQAIDYAVNVDHVDVINESLGANPYPDSNTDPFSLANNAAVAAGVTVVNSAGDAGYGNTTDSPASDPDIISAGASTTYRIMAQTRNDLPGFSGSWESDNVSAISSSGITESGRVYDLMAPGDEGWALCTADPKTYLGCTNFNGQPSNIQAFGGTSEAAPLISGAAALVIQAYGKTHGGAKPTPALVKQILTSTATDEYDPSDRQGAGLLNALAAVQAAESVKDANGAGTTVGNGLLFGTSQLTAAAAPGTAQSFDETVTNVGTAAQTVTAHGRALTRTLADQTGSLVLNTTASGPTFIGPSGAVDNYVTHTFTVPAGADHLDASLAWHAPPNTSTFTMVLLDPKGGFAGYTFPQSGSGAPPNFGHIDVHTPMAGTWTALIYGTHTMSGFDGPVSYEFTSSGYADFGSVTPATLTLAPGQTGTLHVTANTPAKPGDQSAAVEVDSSTQQRFAVPLTLRSLVPNTGNGTFSGTLTGGNGRAGGPAQQNTYWFDVPGGEHDLDVSLSLAGDVNQNVVGYLVSPEGEILSQGSNVQSLDANGAPSAYAKSLQDYVRSPESGRWSFVVIFANPVSGSATQEHYTGAVAFNQVDVTSANVPEGLLTTLPAGKPTTATITVHNTGAAPGSFFVDARTIGLRNTQLTPGNSAANVPLTPFAQVPFTVPTETTSLIGVTSGSIPVSADLATNSGEPEVLGTPGPSNIAVATLSAPPVSQGKWLLEADTIGPFAKPATGTANLALVAHTQGFDTSVTSTTGDQWLGTVQATAPKFTPVEVDSGAEGTITVKFTPTAPKGTLVTGYLYVDDTTVSNNAGDELTAIPYSYTVG